MVARPTDRIDVWCVPFERIEPEQARTLLSSLSTDEQERYHRFRVSGRRDEHLIARVLSRKILGERLGVRPLEVEFVVEPRGRPRLHRRHHSELCFSIAHTTGLVCLAVRDGGEVGVDAESVERTTDREALAPRVHCERERDYIARGSDEADRDRRFFHCWTLKEAVLKATGMGISVKLDRFGFDFSDTGGLTWLAPDSRVAEGARGAVSADFHRTLQDGFGAELSELASEHALAVAWPALGPVPRVHYQWVRLPQFSMEEFDPNTLGRTGSSAEAGA